METENLKLPEQEKKNSELLYKASGRIMEKLYSISGNFNIDYRPYVCLVDSSGEVVFKDGPEYPHGDRFKDPQFYSDQATDRAKKALREKVVGGRRIKFEGKIVGSVGVSGLKDWRDELLVSFGYDLFESKKHGVIPRGWIGLTRSLKIQNRSYLQVMRAIDKAKDEQWEKESENREAKSGI